MTKSLIIVAFAVAVAGLAAWGLGLDPNDVFNTILQATSS